MYRVLIIESLMFPASISAFSKIDYRAHTYTHIALIIPFNYRYCVDFFLLSLPLDSSFDLMGYMYDCGLAREGDSVFFFQN